MKAAIAIPTIREGSIQEFLAAWEDEFRGHHVIVMEGNDERTFSLPNWVHHVSLKEAREDLGEDAWIVSRGSAVVRNYPMLLGARTQPDMIVMLDDDCLPDEDGFLAKHWEALEAPGTAEPLFDTLQTLPWAGSLRARGFPKDAQKAPVMVNHGLWSNVPDFDAETQLANPEVRVAFPPHSIQIPRGVLFPMCAMNVAFRPEALPAMYQPLMGDDTGFCRFEDIWCGWIMKKACDAMGWAVRSGSPAIWHARASDARRNLELEAPGIIENEKVWRRIADMKVEAMDLEQCLEIIHGELEGIGSYWVRVARAARLWRKHARAALSVGVAA